MFSWLEECVITLYQMPSKAHLYAFIHRRTQEYFHSNVMSAVVLHPRLDAYFSLLDTVDLLAL